MTDKDLAHRYADVPSLVADLEDALALEAARQGTSTGEATAVIRTLPARARRRLPFRMRHSLPVLGVIGLIAVARRDRPDRRSREVPHARRARAPGPAGSSSRRPTGTKVVSVPRASAHDYDPLGDDEEHNEEAARVVDRDDGTAWSTESYQDGLEGAGKTGVGIYIDAKPKVAAVAAADRHARAGLQARRSTPPRPAPCRSPCPRAGPRSAAARSRSKDKRFKLDTGGTEYRYYLVWITKLAAGRRQRRDLRDPRSSRKSRRSIEGDPSRRL